MAAKCNVGSWGRKKTLGKNQGNLDKVWTLANDNITSIGSLIVTNANGKTLTVGETGSGYMGTLHYSNFL